MTELLSQNPLSLGRRSTTRHTDGCFQADKHPPQDLLTTWDECLSCLADMLLYCFNFEQSPQNLPRLTSLRPFHRLPQNATALSNTAPSFPRKLCAPRNFAFAWAKFLAVGLNLSSEVSDTSPPCLNVDGREGSGKPKGQEQLSSNSDNKLRQMIRFQPAQITRGQLQTPSYRRSLWRHNT